MEESIAEEANAVCHEETNTAFSSGNDRRQIESGDRISVDARLVKVKNLRTTANRTRRRMLFQ
jgi:hypothetical protein